MAQDPCERAPWESAQALALQPDPRPPFLKYREYPRVDPVALMAAQHLRRSQIFPRTFAARVALVRAGSAFADHPVALDLPEA